ncbi:hypothetical protein PN4B1_48270 [Paenibacillus naphthalenovorans]|uniref:copper amine oxidase N-terminal domain-containing protein n=1 Tax=Paenibacillus naphthalenovorans TaxID=162209 RepID=UPI0010B27435|nr:copper amine oxidase N-terminal domain-containing protein [Paenibacillus naphthalenovorans]GCL74845.1 hypothetical protein PN4B1_48270 [Paenibacillus naphthalenovorans]
MNKFLKMFSITLLSSSLLANVSFAADLNMSVSGNPVQFQYGTPFIDNGSSLLPLRDLLVALGVKNDDDHIRWNDKTQSVTIVKDDKTVILSVGSKQIYLNGNLYKTLEVPAQNVNGRVYLPARAVAEALGYFVGFDSGTQTVLVQETPFGGGVKADDYSNEAEASITSSLGIDTMKLALDKYASGTSLSDETKQVLSKYDADFFAADRNPLSLDKVAKTVQEKDIAKNVSNFQTNIVNLTFMEIDSAREIKLENGQTITGAVGHVGGTYSQITGMWSDSTYFQVFFSGTTKVAKGDKATVNGIPIGESTVELTNALGKKFVEPMYIVVAGNFLKSSTEYDIRKERSETNPGKISFPELDKDMQNKVQRLNLSLNAKEFTIEDPKYDPYLVEIKSIQIMEYTYKPTAKTTMKYDLTIPVSSFTDSKGSPFTGKPGSYFVKVSTDFGEITKFIDLK